MYVLCTHAGGRRANRNNWRAAELHRTVLYTSTRAYNGIRPCIFWIAQATMCMDMGCSHLHLSALGSCTTGREEPRKHSPCILHVCMPYSASIQTHTNVSKQGRASRNCVTILFHFILLAACQLCSLASTRTIDGLLFSSAARGSS